MAAYNGSVEVIAGIKPANNGSFPVVNAPDVQVDDSGKRLDEALSNLDFRSPYIYETYAEYMTDYNAGKIPAGQACIVKDR